MVGHWQARRWLLGAVLLVLAACGEEKKSAAPPAPPPAVVVAPASMQAVAQSATFTGRIQAVAQVDILARIEGFLQERRFTEGAEVKQGDVLFVIQPESYQADVESAQGSLQRAQASLKLADIEVTRQQDLVKRQAVAQQQLDVAVAKQGDSQGAVTQAQAALDQANLNLGYTTITAPIAGRIGRSTFDPGALVSPSSGVLATIVSVDPIYVSFPVSSRQLLQFRQESEARGPIETVVHLRLPDGSVYPHPGKIDFVNVQADQGTDTVIIRATLPNPERLLVDGQIGVVQVAAADPEQVLTVPQSAILVDQQGSYVITVGDDSVATVTRITVGTTQGTFSTVTGGLKEGQRVIVDGVQKVRPGQKVAASEAKPATQG